MTRARAPLSARLRRLWRVLVRWLRRRRRRPPRQLPGVEASPWGARAETLDPDLRASLGDIGDSAVVRDSVVAAIGHFCDLRDLVSGPGSFDLVGDLDLIAEASATLADIIGRAPDVSAVVAVARQRGDDRAGREAAGGALLALRDRTRLLGEVASAALIWGASRSPGDREALLRAAERLTITNARAGASSDGAE